MPPTTFTDNADRVADPPTVRPEASAELSYKLQLFRLTFVPPCPVAAPLKAWFSTSTQPLPSALASATERALMSKALGCSTAENPGVCGCFIKTSTAL